MTNDKLTELIDDADLSSIGSDLLWLARDSIRLLSDKTDRDQLGIGASCIGGNPDLPESVDWPEWEGCPLSFIAQLRLSDLARVQQITVVPKADTQPALFEFEAQPIAPKETASIAENVLPKTGILYFFSFDDVHTERRDWTVSRDAWRVIYFESEEAGCLTRRPPPIGLQQAYLPAHGVSFWREATLPPVDAYELEPLGLTDRQREDYQGLLYDLEEMQFPGSPTHRLLGYPMQIQNNIQEECQLLSAGQYRFDKTIGVIAVSIDIAPSANKKSVPNWRFLLQIENGWGGALYYCLPNDALARQDFSQSWLVLQYD